MKLLLPSLFSFAYTVNAVRLFTLVNNCPTPVDTYINSDPQGSLSPGAQLSRSLADNFTGNIYTAANGGNPNGVSATKAAFYGVVGTQLYYGSSLMAH